MGRGLCVMVVTALQRRYNPKRRFDMQYLLTLYSDESGWEKMTPDQQQQGVAAYGGYTQALSAAGVLKGSNRLPPSGAATRLRTTKGKRRVLARPFLAAKSQRGRDYL